MLDIHSHRPAPYPEGVISMRSLDATPVEGQLYSVGIHPWDTVTPPSEAEWETLETIAADPRVAMIGECGVDVGKGGPMFRQLQILKRHIDLSERLGKPLILHCVKGADIILGLKRDLNPSQPWIIHGFRGKPALASQLTQKGILLSFGEKFNRATVMQMPDDMIFAETDDSILTIEEIIGQLSQAADRDLLTPIKKNIESLLNPLPAGDYL